MTETLESLQAALADRYTLKRELGRGGMAIVYLADDLKHDRSVALKVLHPELAQTLGAERFQLEIKLTARLQHPHILTVLDSGQAAGQLWFTMPFVEGETLRGRLSRERQLSVDSALRIAIEATRALEYAHQHGVIHRDIKPENLLLTTDGTTLVSDFGIARALSASAERITGTGLAIGTPIYMSPEQAAGDPVLDARTDVYTLGIVLYEMLVGESPYTGATAQAVVAKRFGEMAPRVRSLRPTVPETLDRAIAKALALVPADRFASAAEFGQELTACLLSSPSAAPTVVQALRTVRWDKAGGGASRVQVTPELIDASTGVARWQQPFDAPLTGVFEMQGDIAERVAQALNVALGADDYRMLAEAPTRTVAAYDAFLKGEELLGASSDSYPAMLRRAVAHFQEAVALDPMFVMAWVHLAESYSIIYSADFGGLAGSADAAAARRAADRALGLRPDGYEGHLALGFYYLHAMAEYAHALEEAASGLRASPGRPDMLELAASAESFLGLWDSALAHARQAQVLDPRSPTIARTLALTLQVLRRYPEALRAADRGLAHAPSDLALLRIKALIYLAQGDLPGAQSVMRAGPRRDGVPELAFTTVMFLWALEDSDQQRLLRLTPSSFDGHRETWASALAQIHWLRGDKDQARVYADLAREAFETLLRSRHSDYRDAVGHVSLGLMWAFLGQSASAVRAVREGETALRMFPVTKNAVYGAWVQRQLARIYVLVGETDKALDNLEALLERPSYLSPGWLRIDPSYADLRGNPRFERLVSAGPRVR